MPQLDVYRQQQTAQNELRVVRNAQPSAAAAEVVGETITAFGELGMRIQEARAEQEAANLEIEAGRRYDSLYRELEQDGEGNYEDFEKRLTEGSSKLRGELLGKVKSKAVRDAFDLRLKGMESGYIVRTRDLMQRRGVEEVKAGLIGRMASLEDTANDMSVLYEETDPAKTETRTFTRERDVVMAEIRSMQAKGFIGKDEAEVYLQKVDTLAKKADSDRILNALDDALDSGDPLQIAAAKQMFKDNDHRVLPEAREKAESVLEAKTLESRAITKADEFWAKSGGDYGAALNDAYGIQNPEERLAVEARLAQLKNQFDAAVAASDQAQFEEGLSYIVQDKPVPSSVFQKASPKVIKELQDLQRSRREQSLRMASMTADQKAAMKDVSEGNYLKLTAQLTDPQLVLAGRDAVLADPGLRELYDNMLPGEQNKFDQMIIDAKGTGGVPADKTLKAYKDVVALVATSMPNYAKDFRGLGEGDPGVARISQGRTKKASVLDFEGAVMRMVGEELARTGGAEITQDRAKQIAALAFAEAGAKKDGTTKYPIPKDVASGIVATEARTQIIEFRRDNPELWSETTAMVRSKYPDASDALILAEAQRIRTYRDAERLVGFTRGFFGAGNADE